MAMSQSTAMFLLSLPPVRGFFALMFLFMVSAVPFQQDEMGVGARIGLLVLFLMLGTVVWAATLRGFVRDVREPRRLGDAVVLAHRPRRAARAISWIALAVVILDGLAFGVLAGLDGPDDALALCLLFFVVALPVASLLPRLSRWYADGAGRLAVSPDGLLIVPEGGDGLVRIRWTEVGTVGDSASAAPSLTGGRTDGLGGRVRWRPGARAAVARWAAEGFDPTAEEVHALRLAPQWSSDPATVRSSRTGRWGLIAFQGWATLVSALLGGAMIWAVAVGEAPWWILPALGWAPLLGLVILAPRLLRILRTDESRPAEVSPDGWVDHLHGQGLVAWEHIERIEVRGRHALVIARADAPRFTDRDLGNRMNQRFERFQRRSPVRVRSAGPLFREIGPRHLPYPPETGAFALAEDAGRRGRVEVRRER